MKTRQEIKSYQLDSSVFHLHKCGKERSNFGKASN